MIFCSCLPTPLTLTSGGPIFPPVVHQLDFPSIWPAVQSLRRGSVHKSRDDNVVCMCAVEEMCRVCGWVLQRETSDDGCDLAWTLV